MMVINSTGILGYTAMAFAAAALGTQQLAAYQDGLTLHSRTWTIKKDHREQELL